MERSMMVVHRLVRWTIPLCLALSFAGKVSAALFEVTIDTTPLVGQTAALAFDLIDGDGVANNTVLIRNFTLTGGMLGTNAKVVFQ